MPLHRCSLCGDVAAVSTRDGWLCRMCRRSLEFDAMYDNVLPNQPTCANCGGFHDGHGCMPRGVAVVGGAW